MKRSSEPFPPGNEPEFTYIFFPIQIGILIFDFNLAKYLKY